MAVRYLYRVEHAMLESDRNSGLGAAVPEKIWRNAILEPCSHGIVEYESTML